MRISNHFLVGIFILVLIALNIYIIPQQKKEQLELENKAVWEIPTSVDLDLNYVVFSPNSLIQSLNNTLHFQLQSFDTKTGKRIQTKVFSKEIGVAQQVVCIEDALYVVFATSSIYKLDARTLEVLWRTDWKLGIYNWIDISVEQSKDLLLIASSNPYLNLYTFIKQETGEIYTQQRKQQSSMVENTISDIFSPLKQNNWSAYYNFKQNKLVFDSANKDILLLGNNYLMDLNDSLKLTSFAYGSKYLQKTHERSSIEIPFRTKEKLFYLTTGKTDSDVKEITSIQTSAQNIIFRFETKEKRAPTEALDFVDYSFLKKGARYTHLNIHNIAASPKAYLSDAYFVALDVRLHSQSHQEIFIIDLNDLNSQQSFYLPLEQDLLALFCDQKQVYALVRKADKKTYWLAVAIDS